MLQLRDLAVRSDFEIGPLRVSPSRRRVSGPAGEVALEPLIMQAFLLLLDADGRVVTRNDLFDKCWGGVVVGDDSLNQAIAKVRRIPPEVAPGLFEIETIPRTGYRLTGEILASGNQREGALESSSHPALSRRTLIGSAAGLVLAGGTGIALWSVRSGDERRFRSLVEQGQAGLELGDGSEKPAELLRQAVAIRPGDAAAQGLLAYALVANADGVLKDGSPVGVEGAKEAASTSLRLDPTEPNARLAQIQLERSTLDLAATEDRLRAVLASAPNNIFAMRLLWSLLQSTGRSREALTFVDRAIALKPLAAGNNFPLAQLLWILGRTAEADRVIDRAMQFWPNHRYVRFARFTIFTFTGRPRAALAMLDDVHTRPQNFSSDSVALWRISLAALDNPSVANIAAARRANLNAVESEPRLASQAVLVLSALGELDAAFEIANQLLLFQDSRRSSAEDGINQPRASSMAWRFTPWLFTPPAAALRADPRFNTLCDGIGLTDYWRKRGIKPDYQRA